ncbi:unnamed protein product [Paramecium pentaurelia]|uniref:Uncharacterized protein n=1 Tax=Paramecium pentaurelia TaxID=43138 RepID=A0A8S1V502_9CILI|nr:unnamed protein product [Paramecium pentaurelia]
MRIYDNKEFLRKNKHLFTLAIPKRYKKNVQKRCQEILLYQLSSITQIEKISINFIQKYNEAITKIIANAKFLVMLITDLKLQYARIIEYQEKLYLTRLILLQSKQNQQPFFIFQRIHIKLLLILYSIRQLSQFNRDFYWEMEQVLKSGFLQMSLNQSNHNRSKSKLNQPQPSIQQEKNVIFLLKCFTNWLYQQKISLSHLQIFI